ncbi:MAG TPA: hypothetical protein VFE53_13825 [Mucilaginibacter sp.]|jgi:hypothetical protein|nr:hypothetical protein [Mucilaginibacter sp.]
MKKAKTLSVSLLLLTAALTACKKQYQQPKLVISTWQQVSQRLYQTDTNAMLRYDTTFRVSFSSNDYIQIYDDGTCLVSSDYEFLPPSPYNRVNPEKVPAGGQTLNWTSLGNAYVFTRPPYTGLPSPTWWPPSLDTAFIVHGDTLRYQSVSPFRSPIMETVSVGYFVKK